MLRNRIFIRFLFFAPFCYEQFLLSTQDLRKFLNILTLLLKKISIGDIISLEYTINLLLDNFVRFCERIDKNENTDS